MVTIRRADRSDDAALAALDRLVWSPMISPAPRPADRSPFFRDPERVAEVLVAEVDGRVVGYVSVHQSIPLPSHAHVREVNGLAVDPDERGRGIGQRLVDAAKTEAAEQGVRKLTLRVLAPNTEARRLYDRCGFTTEGVLKGEFLLDGRLTDDVLMACRVS